MKIGIAGYGFVGRAFEVAAVVSNEVLVNDPAKDRNEDLSNVDALVICVSTPQADDGTCNIKNVADVLSNAPKVPVLIKSTISLEGYKYIQDNFDLNINFSPEFLRAKTAVSDFLNMKYTIIAGADTNFWSAWFRDQPIWKNLSIYNCTIPEAITIKYAENSFLALKVSFFNQIYDFCKLTNQDFETVRSLLCKDERINEDHSIVTEERGWGGHCFPKDTSAFLKTAEKFDYDLNIIRTAVDYNKKIRKPIDNQ